jgi:sigma-E factor negative regulatory protein RseA
MTKELSALLDGEIEIHETPALWSQLKSDRALPGKWGDYRLIGEALRSEPGLGGDISKKVMLALQEEPVVLAPQPERKRGRSHRAHPLLALAASVAGVAVVGWLALTQYSAAPGSLQVARRAAPPAAMALVSARSVPEYQEYLLAHQANAPVLHMQGGTQHIRTVSALAGRP